MTVLEKLPEAIYYSDQFPCPWQWYGNRCKPLIDPETTRDKQLIRSGRVEGERDGKPTTPLLDSEVSLCLDNLMVSQHRELVGAIEKLLDRLSPDPKTSTKPPVRWQEALRLLVEEAPMVFPGCLLSPDEELQITAIITRDEKGQPKLVAEKTNCPRALVRISVISVISRDEED